MESSTKKWLAIAAGAVAVWFIAVVVFWAARPLTDSVPVGLNKDNLPVSQEVRCNSLFDGDARDAGPLPTLPEPLVYTRTACNTVHAQARGLFIADAIGSVILLGGIGGFAAKRRRRVTDSELVTA